ncbi:SCAN domain-containing protein 3-like [Macrobrachium nipponense]|uniref:SCAN domain-containing protein 3-like n=1 Tax=Macrobrachium nipponense TaxID=159736 RepID=UPI0030C8CCED
MLSRRDRLFQQLCEDNNEEFELVLHIEVRWLSKGNCLHRFVALWDSVISFLSGIVIGQKLVDAKSDIFYLSDIFEKLNVLNKELQGNDSTLFSCKEQLHYDMETRFSDLLQTTVPHWFVDTFIADASEDDVTLQESFIELQNNTTVQARFKRGGHQKLGMNQDVYKKYLLLWRDVKLLLLAFPMSCLVENGFSRVMYLLSKTRNRLDIEKNEAIYIRLSLTAFKPNIYKLAALHQSQGSH